MNSEVDNEGYDVSRIDRSRRGKELHDILKNHYFTIINQVVLIVEAFLYAFFCPNPDKPDKPRIIEYLDSSLKLLFLISRNVTRG